MAINTNPVFKPGQDLTPEQLQQILALRGNHQDTLGQQAWFGSPEGGEYRRIGDMRSEWQMGSGKFSPFLTYYPGYTTDGTGGDAENQRFTGTGEYVIFQPRNSSTWGGNDVADVWDTNGKWIGTNSGATDLRSLARLAAMSYGAYAGAGAAAGSGAGAGTGAATTASSSAVPTVSVTAESLGAIPGLSDVGMGGLTTAGGGTAGGLGAGTLSAESLDAIEGLSSVASEIAPIGSESIIGATEAAAGGGTTAGLTSADKAALYGADGYGTGMTGAQTSVYDGVLKATGSTDLASTLASNSTVASGLDTLADGAKTVASTNGFDTLAKTVVTGALADKGADALTDPVDTSRFDQLFSNLLDEQKKASTRSEDEWQNYINTWRPIQQQYADRVMNFDTPARREQAAQDAGLATARNFDIQRAQDARDMARMGVDGSTIAMLGSAAGLEQAKAEAGAENTARSDIEKTGLQLLSGGANFGRNLVNSSAQQSQIATGTTNSANGVLNTQGNLQNQNTQNKNALVGDLFQTGMQLWGLSDAKKTGTGG